MSAAVKSRTAWSFASAAVASTLRGALPARGVATFSLADYGAVGVDLDHTLASYDMRALFTAVQRDVRQFLVSKGRVLGEPVGWAPLKGLVVDADRGLLLKLDAAGRVERAVRGVRPVPDAGRLYGGLAVPWAMDTPAPPPGWACFRDDFSVPAEPLYAQLVSEAASDQSDAPLRPLWTEMLEAFSHVYGPTGFWVRTLVERPQELVHRCSESVVLWLRALRRDGKRTFLLTSAEAPVVRSMARHCLGDDWMDLFDLVIVDARKPGFFSNKRPFLKHAGDETRPLTPDETLKPGRMYCQGSWSEVLRRRWLGSRRALYIGDSLLDDVLAARGCCDTVAIVREMACEETLSDECEKNWGSLFVSGRVPSLWTRTLCAAAKLAVPSVDVLAELPLTRRLPAFDGSATPRGFYPSPPRALSLLDS
ncbi:5'-nucleotidase domain-containing protein 1 [Ixodes scapularis]|uniref:5'-nucleotidase domain-containing protein 1 n=1 Tax=Ixodes scapularis TaxID=6945 RepID=UPI001A9E810D|nr:5'-nucleotidase domain-containing protein 1 [Ixodes scapularis]